MRKMRFDPRTSEDDEIMNEVQFKILDLRVLWLTIVIVKVDLKDREQSKVEIQKPVQFPSKV